MSPHTYISPRDTYIEVLSGNEGRPLWRPQCDVAVGDVGVFDNQEGDFIAVFHSLQPPLRTAAPIYGLKDGFRIVHFQHGGLSTTPSDVPKGFYSLPSPGSSATAPLDFKNLPLLEGVAFRASSEFTRTENKGGLVFMTTPVIKSIDYNAQLVSYFCENYDSWLEDTDTLAFPLTGFHYDGPVFIYGCLQADACAHSEWFDGGSPQNLIAEFRVRDNGFLYGGITLNQQETKSLPPSPTCYSGQAPCIVFVKCIKGKKRPGTLGRESPFESTSSDGLDYDTPETFPPSPKPHDPLDDILDYLLVHDVCIASNVDILAIASHDDLGKLYEKAQPKDGPVAELLKEFATPVVTTLTSGKKIATIFPLESQPSEYPPSGKPVPVPPQSSNGQTSAGKLQ